MTRTELIIQLLKVAIGLAFGAYFVWWSLQVLDRLTPEYDARTAVVARASKASRESMAWTLAFEHHEDHARRTATATREAAMAAFAKDPGGGSSDGSNQHPGHLEREDCALVAWYRCIYAPSHGRGA